jgi:phage regulator Rha-like protein
MPPYIKSDRILYMSYKKISPHLKEQFIEEFTLLERIYFIKKAREAILIDRYAPGEDLYYYCYFLTQKKRIESISSAGSTGVFRYLAVEANKDIEDTIKTYKIRLDKNKKFVSYEETEQFIKYLEEPD